MEIKVVVHHHHHRRHPDISDADMQEFVDQFTSIVKDAIRVETRKLLDEFSRLCRINQRAAQQLGDKIMLDLSKLEQEVAENTSATASVQQVVTSLMDAFEAAKGDPQAVQDLVDKVRLNNTGLAAAVVAGTTALETTTTTPPPG